MKYVRALIAAAAVLGAAVTIQLTTETGASATQTTSMCGICWYIIEE